MSDVVANALILAFVVAPIALLVFYLLHALGAAWRVQSLLAALPF